MYVFACSDSVVIVSILLNLINQSSSGLFALFLRYMCFASLLPLVLSISAMYVLIAFSIFLLRASSLFLSSVSSFSPSLVVIVECLYVSTNRFTSCLRVSSFLSMWCSVTISTRS